MEKVENILAEKLSQYIELSANLLKENKKLKYELDCTERLVIKLTEEVDKLEDEIENHLSHIDDVEAYIGELEDELDTLVLERAKMYEIERKTWENWQKLKKEFKY